MYDFSPPLLLLNPFGGFAHHYSFLSFSGVICGQLHRLFGHWQTVAFANLKMWMSILFLLISQLVVVLFATMGR